jgi:UDP-glucose 4-epimerase
MVKLIITGGLGFIGSHTCTELLDDYDIIIIDNLINSDKNVLENIKKITANKKHNIIFFEMDLLDKIELDKIFNEHLPYGVIHFAGLKSVNESIKNPLLYYQNNLISTLNLIEVMNKYECYNLIFSSSAVVYGDQESPFHEKLNIGQNITNPYGQTKYMLEQILKDICISNNKMNIISLRYFNPIGAHKSGLLKENPNGIPNNLMPYILNVATKKYTHINIFGNDYNTNDGTCKRDYIHVLDIAKGHLSAINKINNLNGYNVFNLGTGKPTSVIELINIFQKVNNITIPYKFACRRDGDLAISYCDPSSAHKILEWTAELSIEDMCKDSFI